MIPIIRSFLALILASVLLASPSTAFAHNTVLVTSDPYAALYDAIFAGRPTAAETEASLAMIRAELPEVPAAAKLEEQYPGFYDVYVETGRPFFRQHAERIRVKYRPRIESFFRANLTDEEAAGAARFYRSDIGQKLIGNFSRNLKLDNIGARDTTTIEDVSADFDRASAAAAKELTAADVAEVARWEREVPAVTKMAGEMRIRMRAIRAEMDNEPLADDLYASFIDALAAAIEVHKNAD